MRKLLGFWSRRPHASVVHALPRPITPERPRPRTIVMDRPCISIMRHVETGQILFLGKVLESARGSLVSPIV